MGKKVHFIGIAGVGMSATALLLREQGWEVSGSDESFYPPVSTYLAEKHIPIHTPYAAENIPADIDLIVIGKNAKLTMENPEVAAAHERGVPIKNFAQVLGDIASERESIVCVGSYGKSSTTALMAHCLVHAGRDPGYFVGAISHDLPATAHLGTDPVFIIEGDEYPSGHDDPQSKFLHFSARDVLLTSAEHDHVNVFPTHEAYLAPFRELLAHIPENGILMGCTDDTSAPSLFPETPARVVTYALKNPEADYYGANIRYAAESTFDLIHRKEKVTTLTTSLLGAHNVQNIIGVAGLLLERALLTPEELAAGIASFGGIVRRLDKKTAHSRIPLYEGFGTSHAKARTAIEALRLHFPEKRLIVLFEPHTFSWRNRAMLHWYDNVFDDVAHVLVYEPASQGAEAHEQLSQAEIVARIKESGAKAEAIHSLTDTQALLRNMLQDGDMVLMLSSGAMDGIIASLPQWMDVEYA